MGLFETAWKSAQVTVCVIYVVVTAEQGKRILKEILDEVKSIEMPVQKQFLADVVVVVAQSIGRGECADFQDLTELHCVRSMREEMDRLPVSKELFVECHLQHLSAVQKIELLERIAHVELQWETGQTEKRSKRLASG